MAFAIAITQGRAIWHEQHQQQHQQHEHEHELAAEPLPLLVHTRVTRVSLVCLSPLAAPPPPLSLLRREPKQQRARRLQTVCRHWRESCSKNPLSLSHWPDILMHSGGARRP